MTHEEMVAEIERLKAENTKLVNKNGNSTAANRVTVQLSQKGAISLYGLGRFPVTLYASQWERLFEAIDTIKAFMVANKEKLAVKPAKVAAE